MLSRLRSLREASALAWEMASDTCYVGQTDEIDVERQAECQDAADSALELWDAAIDAAEAEDIRAAVPTLFAAAALAADWGDASHEIEAIELLAPAAEGGAR